MKAPDRGFENKVVLVTGGSSGIGRATAQAFAREGARVVIADIDVQGGKATVETIRQMGGNALFLKTDVSKEAEVELLIQETVGEFGRLDFAHNHATTGADDAVDLRRTADYDEETWDRTIDVNLKGVWLCMKYELRQMRQQQSGAIVNTASVLGLVGGAGRCAYVASKHGVIGLTQAAAREYGRVGIRINAICPALICSPGVEGHTGSDPTSAERVAEAVLWLCSPAALFMSGQALILDGGAWAH